MSSHGAGGFRAITAAAVALFGAAACGGGPAAQELAAVRRPPLPAEHERDTVRNDHGERHGKASRHADPTEPVGDAHDRAIRDTSELDRMLAEVRAATEHYRDLDAARAEGFVRFGNLDAPLMGEHWYQPDRVAEPFDHRRPSTLMYARIDGEPTLIGVAYSVYRRPEDPLPEGFPGHRDAWHIHDIEKIAHVMTERRPVARWLVNRRLRSGDVGGGDGRTQLTMLHAWVWLEHPDFVFANEHRLLPYLRAGLPASYADGADLDAANGIALLGDTQCQRERGIIEKVARAGRRRAAGLRESCARAAAIVRAAFAARATAAELNAAAAAAWREYESAKSHSLTAEQAARIAAWVDHPHAH